MTGKVTKGGQPVAGAAVTFVPQGAGTDAEAKPAAGTTDASGVYTLTTFVNGDGALPGSYKVIVTKFPGAAGPAGSSTPKEFSQADMDAAYRAVEAKGVNVSAPGTTGEIANELPAKFANVDSSGLAAEVKAGAANSFDFDVTGP